jgi:hypothetical protein
LAICMRKSTGKPVLCSMFYVQGSTFKVQG